MVGTGNRFRSDDCAGLKAVSLLQQRASNRWGVEVTIVDLEGDQSAILDHMNSTDVVIIIDAVHSDGQPGSFVRIDSTNGEIPLTFDGNSTHGYGTSYVLRIAKMIGVLPQRVIIYGIAGKNFSSGTDVSPEVTKSVDTVVEKVSEEIDSLIEGT